MTMTTIGDLARSFVMRHQNAVLKGELNTLTAEIGSGQTQNVARHLGGDYSYLSDIEQSLRIVKGYGLAASEATQFTDTMQTVLGAVQDTTTALSADLLMASNGALPSVRASVAHNAAGRMDTIVSALNTSVAGRGMFAGIATDRPALAPADTMLAALRPAIAGLTDPVNYLAAIDAWFAPGGGFDTVGYLGATTSLAPFRVAQGSTIDLDLRADDARLRAVLADAAAAALSTDPAASLDDTGVAALQRRVGERILSTNDALTGLRADLGFAQSRLEEASSRLAAERTALDYARGSLLSVDPYESATRLEETEFRLESLYAVTARLSRLSLMEYLR